MSERLDRDAPADATASPPARPGCPSSASAGATSSELDLSRVYSRFLIVHERYEVETNRLIDRRQFEVSDIAVAAVAGLDTERLAQLPSSARDLVYELIYAGEDPAAAFRHVEQQQTEKH
jgi:hypothetical protein